MPATRAARRRRGDRGEVRRGVPAAAERAAGAGRLGEVAATTGAGRRGTAARGGGGGVRQAAGGGGRGRRRRAGAGRGGRIWAPGPLRRLAVECHVAAPGWGGSDVRLGADNVRPREVEI